MKSKTTTAADMKAGVQLFVCGSFTSSRRSTLDTEWHEHATLYHLATNTVVRISHNFRRNHDVMNGNRNSVTFEQVTLCTAETEDNNWQQLQPKQGPIAR